MRRVVLVVMVFTIIPLCACRRATTTPIPLIPSEYFNCTDVDPQVLFDNYYACWADNDEARGHFDNTYIVFKNIRLTNDMFKDITQGNFWVLPGEIDCYLLHPAETKSYKVGDKIDVVGLNTDSNMGLAGLVFKNCIVLLAGSVQLPAPGSGGVFVPNY